MVLVLLKLLCMLVDHSLILHHLELNTLRGIDLDLNLHMELEPGYPMIVISSYSNPHYLHYYLFGKPPVRSVFCLGRDLYT